MRRSVASRESVLRAPIATDELASDDSYFGPSEENEDANHDVHVASWSHSRARLVVGDSRFGRPSTWPLRTVTLIFGFRR